MGKFNILVLLLVFVGFFGMPVQAKKKKIVFKAATVAPDHTPWAKSAKLSFKRIKKAAQKNKEKSKNYKFKAKIYFGGVLGGENETLRRLKNGNLDFWAGTNGAVSSDIKAFSALDLPYLFENHKQIDHVLNNIILEDAKRLFEKNGYYFNFWSENGFRSLATKKKAINSVKDLKGMKFRSQEQMNHLETFKSWGASPVPIPVPEVIISLNTGLVDGFDNTPLFMFATGWYNNVEFYTLTKHIFTTGVVLGSKKKFDKYPEFVKKAILAINWKRDQTVAQKSIRKFQKILLENLQKKGLKIIEPNAEQKKSFMKNTNKVYQIYRKKSSPEGRALLDKILKGLGR